MYGVAERQDPMSQAFHNELLGIQPNLIVHAYQNQAYGLDSPSQTLDAYLVKPPSTNRCVITIHGGGWIGGDRYYGHGPFAIKVIKGLLAADINVVNISYRLAPNVYFPAPLHDVLKAIRWVKTNYSGLCIDVNKIGLFGASAGGHLATLAATAYNFYGNENPNPKPRAISVASVPFDFLRWDSDAILEGYPLWNGTGFRHPDSPLSKLLGTNAALDSQELANASCINYVNSLQPKMQIHAGLTDQIVSNYQASRYVSNLIAHSAPYSYTYLNAGHNDGAFLNQSTIDSIVNFFEVNL